MMNAMQWRSSILAVCCLFSLPLSPLEAEVSAELRQQLEKAEQLLNGGARDEGVQLLDRLNRDYPDNPSAAVALGRISTAQEQYAQSVTYYEEALRRWELLPAEELETVELETMTAIRYQLVNDYNELGQQRYFSPELCLRIVYHLDRAWPQLMKEHPTSESLRHFVEFARKTVGHYDMANMAPNLRVMEGSSQRSQDKLELVLPSDGIAEGDKLQAKEAIAARIRAFDAAQPAELTLVPSDKTLEEVVEQLEKAYRQVTSIVYRKYQAAEGREELVESTWYQAPQQLKTHQHGAWMIIANGRLTRFDPTERRIFSQESIGGEPGWLMEVRKPHRRFLEASYAWDVKKLSKPPAFLGSLYETSPANLYVLTGKSKSPDGGGDPPVVKSEYIVDLDRGLLVGLREYWHGVLGSGRDEELAVTDIVTQWKRYGDTIFLPVAGRREQLVDESTPQGPTHRVQSLTWRIAVEQVNTPLAPKTFDLSGYAALEPSSALTPADLVQPVPNSKETH